MAKMIDRHETYVKRQLELKLLQAKEDYRDHRGACNTCTGDELCDVGGLFHEAVRNAGIDLYGEER